MASIHLVEEDVANIDIAHLPGRTVYTRRHGGHATLHGILDAQGAGIGTDTE